MRRRILAPLVMISAVFLAVLFAVGAFKGRGRIRPERVSLSQYQEPGFVAAVRLVNQEFDAWTERLQVERTGKADNFLVARRISLALIGSGLSLEDIRALETIPQEEQIQWWTNYLLNDRRWADYFAERFSRAIVGTDSGPFLLFRRGRFNTWLSDQFYSGVGYDQIVQKIVASEGLWTDTPQVNFITASMSEENSRKCDPVILTGRVSRTFLAQRIDCLQCHDDFLNQHNFGISDQFVPGEQVHFHELAAFFGGTALPANPFAGIKETGEVYRTKLLGQSEESEMAPQVPFLKELLEANGKPRQRLANWIVHQENFAFQRATVNRVWALLTSRPIVTPVDSIPLDDSVPPILKVLSSDFAENGYDLRRLIRLIVSSDAFQRSSQADFEITPQHELCYAVFPVSQLRPEQVAGSIVQAAKLRSINAGSSILVRLASFGDRQSFLNDFGDKGMDEFENQAVTIPQRLVLMNGSLVTERTTQDIVNNAITRIEQMVSDHEKAIELVFLAVVGRSPSDRESKLAMQQVSGQSGGTRSEALSDLFWALMNSTEFSWNH